MPDTPYLTHTEMDHCRRELAEELKDTERKLETTQISFSKKFQELESARSRSLISVISIVIVLISGSFGYTKALDGEVHRLATAVASLSAQVAAVNAELDQARESHLRIHARIDKELEHFMDKVENHMERDDLIFKRYKLEEK